MRLEKFPGSLVRFRPVFPEDAAADLAALGQFLQAPLHGDANVAARAGRAIAVDQLQQRCFVLTREGQFVVHTLQGFVDQRHVGLEVCGFHAARSENKVWSWLRRRG